MEKQSVISVINTKEIAYPAKGCGFRPHMVYPEIEELGLGSSMETNWVYDAVRKALFLLGLDTEHYETAEWNPLKDLVHPGDCVLIKPNLVMDQNHIRENGIECLYTHPSVVAPLIDYTVKALRGTGKIVVGDAPMQECRFERLMEESGYQEMILRYQKHGIPIEMVDFRELTSEGEAGIYRHVLKEGATGKIIDLGDQSEFRTANQEEIERMRITNYDPRILQEHHSEKKHEYYVSDYVLNADVIISVPKPKTHRKGGVTISLKNCVGINTRKEFLPHHTMGSQMEAGDEYEKKNAVHALQSRLYDKRNICVAEEKMFFARIYQTMIKGLSVLLKLQGENYREGSWWGNDTISRTICDLNKIIQYADRNGCMQDKPVRKLLIVADMIISGEKEGPVAPTPKGVGKIVAGTNPVCFDETVATLMGFDYKKIPAIVRAREITGKYSLIQGEKPFVVSDDERLDQKMLEQLSEDALLRFEPTGGWKGHIELSC